MVCGVDRSTEHNSYPTFLFWSGILFLCSLVPRQSLRDFPKWGRPSDEQTIR
jgi:hypothetical protein